MARVPSKIRQQVRQRADNRCEYCHIPEGHTAFPHQADHIVPQKHDGASTLDNLAWACFQCNNAKGSDVAAYDEQKGLLTPLYNPRTQTWVAHFVMDGAIIVGETTIGRVTARILRMNRSRRIALRAQLIRIGRF